MEDIQKEVDLIIQACEDKKGIDIKAIDVSKRSSIADRFIIVSGNSDTQVKAISDSVEEAMEEYRQEQFPKEGYSAARWVVLDFNNIIVHVFHKDEREFYNLERLWEEEEFAE